MKINNLAILTALSIASCGKKTKIEREEILVPAAAVRSAPVICEVFEGQATLPTVHQVRGTYRIGVNSSSFAEVADENKPFAAFVGTAAEVVTKNFAMRCTFGFEVINTGTHTFKLNSDDGSELYVNGVRVINNGGSHGMLLKSAAVSLPAGVHNLAVTYQQGNGAKGLILSVQKPAIAVPEQGL